MRQQIELLTADLIAPAEWLTFDELAALVGGFVLVLALCSGAQLAATAHARAQLQQQQAELTQVSANNDKLRLARGNDPQVRALAGEVAALGVAQHGKQRLLALVSSKRDGRHEGFAPYFEALARNHVDGLWIKHIAIDTQTGGLDLAGEASDAAVVPVWLGKLRGSVAFADSAFSGLALAEQKTADGVGFTIKGTR